jgi:REP element-mobilizing transposase RayT
MFGDVVNDQMQLSRVGEIIGTEWSKTPGIRPGVELDDYVIMPNHLHGIVIIGEPRRGVSQYAPTENKPFKALRSPSQTLGAIMRGFKSATTKRINLLRVAPGAPVWQRNYYEHIIRNDVDLHRIRTYITNNPLQWAIDEENPVNISG